MAILKAKLAIFPKLQILDPGSLTVVLFDPVYIANHLVSKIKDFLLVFSNPHLIKEPFSKFNQVDTVTIGKEAFCKLQ